MPIKPIIVFILIFFAGCRKSQAPVQQSLSVKKIADSTALGPRDSMGEVSFKGLMWLFGGFTPDRSNEVWFSADGIDWIKAPDPNWPKRNLPGTIVFKNKIFLMGGIGGAATTGFLNDVYSSDDGLQWQLITTSAPWSARAAFGLCVLNDIMYLFGGIGGFSGEHYNDVWFTTDGANWQQLTASAPWSKRGMMGTTIFNNRMWLIGGGEYDDKFVYNVGVNYNDVWSSANGIDWTNETPAADFSPRRFFGTITHNSKIYIMSGFELDSRIFPNNRNGLLKSGLSPTQLAYYDTHKGRYYGNLNDIWESTNGKDWRKSAVTDTFRTRHEASVLPHRNSIYLIGGFGADLYNDVWKID